MNTLQRLGVAVDIRVLERRLVKLGHDRSNHFGQFRLCRDGQRCPYMERADRQALINQTKLRALREKVNRDNFAKDAWRVTEATEGRR